jgi:RNA polymerase sigma-70 factor (ECF subfamily)
VAGELQAFDRLVELYQDYLYGMIVRMVRDRELAEDAVQDAFFSAYRNLASFNGPSFRAWLTRIALNAARDILRKRKRRPSEPYPEWEDDTWQPPAPAGEGPEQQVLVGQQRAALARAMAGITDDQRTAIVLFDVHGYDYAEIAQLTSVSVGTVKSRIHRGRLALRERLGPGMELFRG